MTKQEQNAKTISEELKWFSAVVDARFKSYFQTDQSVSIYDVAVPDLSTDTSSYAQCIRKYELSFQERIILVLAIALHIQPQTLDLFLIKNANVDKCYTEFGGFKTATNSGFFPTGETAAFILAGDDINTRFSVAQLFDKNQNFYKWNILKLASTDNSLPILSGAIQLQTWVLNYITVGELSKPDFGINFPAKLITTELEFSDLVIDNEVLNDLDEITAWLKHGHTLMQEWHLKSI